MPRYEIDHWEKEQAEVEIRRWLQQIGQWAPQVEMERLQRLEESELPLGALSDAEIEHVLQTEIVGHIGCHADGRTYVVPIIYAYADGCIYGHSGDGMKIQMMRENPEVCFEVEHIEHVTNWRSVIAWGRFEELTGSEAEHALQLIIARIQPLMEGKAIAAPPEGPLEGAERAAVIYRIVVMKRSGRYERR